MKRLLAIGLLVLLAVAPALAQLKPITQPLHTAETGDENGNEITVDGYSSISLQVTNTGTGTIAFQGTQNQSTWSAVVCIQVGDTTYTPITETTTTMTVRCNVAGLVKFRAPITGNDGAVTVTATSSPAVMGSGGGGGSGSGSGITAGTSFPGSPSTNQLFLITDDSAAGECDSDAGSAVTLCRYDGADWQPVNILDEAQGLGDVITINRTFGGAVSQATGVRIGDDGSSEYWNLHRDATTGLTFDCEKSGVLGDCDKKIKIYTGHVFDFLNNANTSIGKLTESTGAWTNFTLDGEGSGNTITLTDIKWFDAAACQAGTAQLVWNVPSSNAPAAACDPDSTPNAYASFDASTDESFDFDFVLPPGFTGAIDAHFIWKAAATSGAAGWCMQLVRVPDATTSGQSHAAQSSSNCVSDTAKGTTLQENRADKTGVTCTSCAAGDRVKGRISRDANGGAVTDDMAGDAHLIKFGYTLRDAK